jgi:hypothetical protein
MTRRGLLLLATLFLVTPALARAQQTVQESEDKGTYLGALFGPLPEALYDQLPQLPRGQGVLITHILPDSPAAKADLHRHDIVLSYDNTKVRDGEHFARLIQADKPDRVVKLSLLRGGKEQTAEVTLSLGPVLKISQAKDAGSRPARGVGVPRATAKPGSPPAVSVSATPLDNGKLKVTIEYYQEGTGRLKSITCEGQPDEIDGEIKKLPERERKLAEVAFQRIRGMSSQNKGEKR